MLWCLIKNKDDFSLVLYDSRLDAFPYKTGVTDVLNDNATDCDTMQLRYRVEM